MMKTENLSFQEASDLALANGCLFTRPKYTGRALFYRPAHTATAGEVAKYTSVPVLAKDVINEFGADAKVEFSHYLCSLAVSEGGGVIINQSVVLDGYDVYAKDWKLITDANYSKHVVTPNL